MKNRLDVVGTVVPKKTTLPVLQHVVIDAGTDSLTLTTTDMEVSLRATVPAQVDKPGKVLAPLAPLRGLAGILGSRDMDIQGMASHKTRVRQGNLESNLKGIDPEEAPLVQFGGAERGRMDADMFRRAIGWASSCASRTLDRPMLETVYMSTRGGKTHFVGTDGFRMAVASLPVEVLPEDMVFMLPNRALVKNWKIYRDMNLKVAEGEDPVQVIFRESKGCMTFEYPEFRTSHRLSGLTAYADYESIVPGKWNVRAVLDLDLFLDALKVVRTMAKRRGDFSETVFQIKAGPPATLTLYSFTDEDGDVAMTVPIEEMELATGTNLKYMPFVLNSYWTLKALSQFRGAVEEVAVEIVGPDKPFIFRPVGDTVWAGSYSFQMPMQDDKVIAHAEGQRLEDEKLVGDDDDEEL